jgi:hypothetical protein
VEFGYSTGPPDWRVYHHWGCVGKSAPSLVLRLILFHLPLFGRISCITGSLEVGTWKACNGNTEWCFVS